MEPSEVHRIASMRRNSSIWKRDDNIFSRSSRDEDDEEALKWAALEKLPTYDRVRRGILALTEDGRQLQEVDIQRLGLQERKTLMERLVRVAEEDNERFLLKLKDRIDRMTLLLGPPGSGKTTLLLALAGKLSSDLKVKRRGSML
ncbi:hypothetical protein BHE74_00003150 [Ensete ventricosum]|nr:hypothetical protein BHE74_00003150 [Ensete ventricosum]